jgi:hypothetical protein
MKQGNFTTERERGGVNKTLRAESLLCENFKVLKMSPLKSHPRSTESQTFTERKGTKRGQHSATSTFCMAHSLPTPCAPTHVRSTSETEFDGLCSSDTLGRHYAQSLDVSDLSDLTLDESVYRAEPAMQDVEAHRSTFNYSGNPPQRISSDAARWCAQNRSGILWSVPVMVPARGAVLVPAVVLAPTPAVLLAVAVAVPVPVSPGLLLPVAVLCIPSVNASEIRMTTNAFNPAPTTFHGGSMARRDVEPPAIHKVDGKPKMPVGQEVEAHRSTCNYSGNPPQKISSDAARWCAQNQSRILWSVPVMVPAPAVVLVPAPAVLLAVAVAVPVPVSPGLLLPVAVLCIPSVTDSEIRMTTRAFNPATTTFHGGSMARCNIEPPAIHKIDGKQKIDGNFFKSMAKSIKANRASLIVDEAGTEHTGYYTSSSCENTPFQHWIEGDAMRMRIELKFRLIHQRMLAR